METTGELRSLISESVLPPSLSLTLSLSLSLSPPSSEFVVVVRILHSKRLAFIH
jgi:hypothetical protein